MAFHSAAIIDWQVFSTLSIIAANYGICNVLESLLNIGLCVFSFWCVL